MARSQIVDSNGKTLDLNPNGSLPVQLAEGQSITLQAGDITVGDLQSKTEDFTFQDIATTTASGAEFDVRAFKDLTIEIYGTSTSRTVVFEAAGSSGAYKPIQGVKNDDFAMGTQTSGNNESWSFTITGQKKFRVRISAVSGGNVTVKGTAVA